MPFTLLCSLVLFVAILQLVDSQSCSYAGYDLSPMLNLTTDLTYTTNEQTISIRSKYILRPCSYVSQPECARNATACVIRTSYKTNDMWERTIDWGWNGSSPTYTFPGTSNGLQVAWQNGLPSTDVLNDHRPRLIAIGYVCDTRTPIANITLK